MSKLCVKSFMWKSLRGWMAEVFFISDFFIIHSSQRFPGMDFSCHDCTDSTYLQTYPSSLAICYSPFQRFWGPDSETKSKTMPGDSQPK